MCRIYNYVLQACITNDNVSARWPCSAQFCTGAGVDALLHLEVEILDAIKLSSGCVVMVYYMTYLLASVHLTCGALPQDTSKI